MKKKFALAKTQTNHQFNPSKRLPAVLLLVAFLFIAVFGKMIAVMLVDGRFLQVKAIDQWMRDLPSDAPRGSILDRNKNKLAATSTRYNLYVRPSDTSDKPAVARLLADVFGYDYNSTLEKISKRTSEVTVATKATKRQLDAIYSAGLDGIYYAEDNFRYYPYGDFLTQALGFCSSDGFGQTGLEAYYDKYLTGVNGKVLAETDLVGRQLAQGGSYYLPSIPGFDIVTALDVGIQRIAEGAIDAAVAKFSPKAAYCVVMDYTSGAIAALAEYPSFDLNAVPRDDLEALFSHSKSAVASTVYEPGSTFKILTAAAALDAGVMTVSDRFYCPGFHIVDGQRIRCWKAKGHGSIDFGDGVEGSCNVVFMQSALKLGTERFYDYLADFGLMQKTGVDMTGETSGIFINRDSVKNVDLARVGFGQAVAVTPIGLLAATSAVINGGVTITPHLMSYMLDANGNTIYPEVSQGKRVISAQTSVTMRQLLQRVVTAGSGKSVYTPGYTIAGKTGTAQKYSDGSIASGKYISSFLGFSLNKGAEYAVLMIVDEPQGYMYYGSLVAAPLVGDIFRSLFDYLDVKPVYTGEEADIVGEPFALPDFVGMPLSQARAALNKLGLYCEIDGDGNSVKSQFPTAGVIVDKRNAVLLIT